MRYNELVSHVRSQLTLDMDSGWSWPIPEFIPTTRMPSLFRSSLLPLLYFFLLSSSLLFSFSFACFNIFIFCSSHATDDVEQALDPRAHAQRVPCDLHARSPACASVLRRHAGVFCWYVTERAGRDEIVGREKKGEGGEGGRRWKKYNERSLTIVNSLF